MGSGGSKSKRKEKANVAVGGQATAAAGNPEDAQLSQDGVTPSGQNSTAEPKDTAAAGAAGDRKESPEDQTAAAMGDEYVEAVVAKASEFGDNE